jgi:Protein of unknown function, DUF547
MKLLSNYKWLGLVVALSLTACNQSPTNSTAPSSLSSPTATAMASGFNHKPLDELLSTYVGRDGWVDYAALQKDRAKLDAYVATLATAQHGSFPNDAERLAFWINAYNANTLVAVLDDIYGKHKSVKEIEQEFFKTKKHPVAGEQLTLDEIEKKGRDMKDPRIHFVVNCASASCPKLQRYAFTGAELETQLTQATRDFLGDSTRGMNYVPGSNEVYLSPIFKWYAGDFTNESSTVARVKAETSGQELLEVAKKYVPAEVANFLTEKKPKVKYLEYDWTLNDKNVQQQQAAPKN